MLKEVSVMPKEKSEEITPNLSAFATFVSKTAKENYELIKQNKINEILKSIIEILKNTLEADEIKKNFLKIISKYFEPDRCLFMDYDKAVNKFLPFRLELLNSKDISSLIGVEPEKAFPEFCEKLKTKQRSIIVKDLKKTMSRKNFFNYEAVKSLEESNVKSDYGLAVEYRGEIMGALILHYVKEKKVLIKDEFDFLKILRDNTGTALHQAELYEKSIRQAEKELLIRKIISTIRDSLNINETKKTISEIIGKTLHADRCFILEYNETNDKILMVNQEYLSSENILPYTGVDLNEHIPSLVDELKKGKKLVIDEKGVAFDGEKINLNDTHHDDILKALEKYSVNSALVFPLFYGDKFLGDLVLHYVETQHKINKEDIEFLNMLSDQISIALHQSKLYEKIQLQAEREKINRNIIEILRSTLDKSMIKHLFVKNIGKYFNADRVFFSDYDSKTNTYLPVEARSEYLSGAGEVSCSERDFFSPDMLEYIKPLTEKREILIPNLHGYIEKNYKNNLLAALYKEAGIKSSYSFPVLYEGKPLGYFCIEFTHKLTEFMREDINRIRNICTQAGIALHHADLYLKAQDALKSREEVIKKVQNRLKEPVKNIIEKSKMLSKRELERDKQVEYLNNIINSCNELLELTQSIDN